MAVFVQVSYPLLSEVQVHASETLNGQFIKKVKSKEKFNGGYNDVFSLPGLFSGNQYYQGPDFSDGSNTGIGYENNHDSGKYYVYLDEDNPTPYSEVFGNYVNDVGPNAASADKGELCPYVKATHIVDESLPTNVHRDDECSYAYPVENGIDPLDIAISAYLNGGDMTPFFNTIAYTIADSMGIPVVSDTVNIISSGSPYTITATGSSDITTPSGTSTGYFDEVGLYTITYRLNNTAIYSGTGSYTFDFSSIIDDPGIFLNEESMYFNALGSTLDGRGTYDGVSDTCNVDMTGSVGSGSAISVFSAFLKATFTVEVVDDKQVMTRNDLIVSEDRAPRSKEEFLDMANVQIMEVEDIQDRDNVEYIGQTFDADSAIFEVDVPEYNYSNPRAGSYNVHVTSIDPITGFEVEGNFAIKVIDTY